MQLASLVLLLVVGSTTICTAEDHIGVTELPPPPQIEEVTEDDILPEVVVHLAPEETTTETLTTQEQPQGHRQKKSPYCVQVHGGAPHEGPYEVCDQKSAIPYNGGRPDYDPLHNLAQAAIASAAYGAAHYATHPEAPPLTPYVMQPVGYPHEPPVAYEANYHALPSYAALKAPPPPYGAGSYGERISLMPAYTSSGSSKMRADSEDQKPKRIESVIKNDTKSLPTPTSTGRASDYNPSSMYHPNHQYQTPYQMPMKVVGYVSASPVGFGPYGGGQSYSASNYGSNSAPHSSYGGNKVNSGYGNSYGNSGTAYGREYTPPSPSYSSGGSSPSYGSSSSYGSHSSAYTAPASASHTYSKPAPSYHKEGYSSNNGSGSNKGSDSTGGYNSKTSPSYSSTHYGSNHPSGANYASGASSTYGGSNYGGNSYGAAPHHYSASPSYGSVQTYNSPSPYSQPAHNYAPSAPAYLPPAMQYAPQNYNPPPSPDYGANYRDYEPNYYSPVAPAYAPPSAPYGSSAYGSNTYGAPHGGGYSVPEQRYGGYGRPSEAQNYGSYGGGGGYSTGPAYSGAHNTGSYGSYQGASIPLSISCQVQPANMYPAIGGGVGGGYESYRESNVPPSSHKPESSAHPQTSTKPQSHKSSSEESDEKPKAREDATTTPRTGSPSDTPKPTPSKSPSSATQPTASARSSGDVNRFPQPPFPQYGPEYY